MNIPHYHEDMFQLHVGTLPSRAYFIPHGERDTALQGLRTASSRMTLSPSHGASVSTAAFWICRRICSPRLPRRMPSQCLPYGSATVMTPISTSMPAFPSPYDPPYVPVENPCGLYTRSFHWSASEEGARATLHFEGVDSCMYVWVNGTFVGYSQVAHSTSAFDVTTLLREVENSIHVLVLKWCDGTYFEDQDKFRQSGIFRDVYILRRSACRLEDYFVHTSLADDFLSADIHVELERSAASPVAWQLLDAEGTEIHAGTTDGDITFHLDAPRLWSSESPDLYTLVMHCGDE